MAKRRIGALIAIERDTGMGDYIETGIPLNAQVSSELLINIFIPNTPPHDGAVIMKNNEIAAVPVICRFLKARLFQRSWGRVTERLSASVK